MLVQENSEIMPTADAVWSEVTGKVLICPTAGKKIANAYGYNGNLSNLGLGDIPDPVEVICTADANTNVMTIPSHLEVRHVEKLIAGYVDGHVAYIKNGDAITGLCAATENEMATVPFSGATSKDGETSGKWTVSKYSNASGVTWGGSQVNASPDEIALLLTHNASSEPYNIFVRYALPAPAELAACSWWSVSFTMSKPWYNAFTGSLPGPFTGEPRGNTSYVLLKRIPGSTDSSAAVSALNTAGVKENVILYSQHSNENNTFVRVASNASGALKEWMPRGDVLHNAGTWTFNTAGLNIYNFITAEQNVTVLGYNDNGTGKIVIKYGNLIQEFEDANWNKAEYVEIGSAGSSTVYVKDLKFGMK